MNNFEYPHPEASNAEKLSGLSNSARATLSNMVLNQSETDELLKPGNLKPGNEYDFNPEAEEWALPRLTQAIEKWEKFNSSKIIESIPTSTYDFILKSKNLSEAIDELYLANLMLYGSGEETPEGINIADSMELVLIPWDFYQKSLEKNLFINSLDRLRSVQGIEKDLIDPQIIRVIHEDMPIYLHPASGGFLSTKQYVDFMVETHGPWGLMLAQANNQAGTKTSIGESANNLNKNGFSHMEIGGGPLVNGQDVDFMGILEWIALTLQEDPKQISRNGFSVLLANRLELQNDDYVPFGAYIQGGERLFKIKTSEQDERLGPRLAVMYTGEPDNE